MISIRPFQKTIRKVWKKTGKGVAGGEEKYNVRWDGGSSLCPEVASSAPVNILPGFMYTSVLCSLLCTGFHMLSFPPLADELNKIFTICSCLNRENRIFLLKMFVSKCVVLGELEGKTRVETAFLPKSLVISLK